MNTLLTSPTEEAIALRPDNLNQVIHEIGKLKVGLARLEEEVLALLMPSGSTKRNAKSAVRVTDGGSVRHLDRSILELLRSSSTPLSSEEIASRLHEGVPMPFPMFKRRVIMTLSYMGSSSKGRIPAVKYDPMDKGREKYWTIIERE